MAAQTTWKISWINSLEQLNPYLDQLLKEDYLSVDTETVGWQTGNEKLALVQIGLPSQEEVLLIDPLAFPEWIQIGAALEATSPLIVAHNASFEKRQFARHGLKMRGVADTMKMAGRLRKDMPNKTLKTCCKYVLDFELDKEQQTSEWDARPLSPEQLDYAALDAEITSKLYEELVATEERLEVDHDASIEHLMGELLKTEQKNFILTKDIAAELELLSLRKEMLKEAIRNKLIDGEEPYEGDYGSAAIQKVRRTEVNPTLVRELLPEIADAAIVESVQKQRLKSLIEEYGLDKAMIDEVSELLRYDERLKLKLADI